MRKATPCVECIKKTTFSSLWDQKVLTLLRLASCIHSLFQELCIHSQLGAKPCAEGQGDTVKLATAFSPQHPTPAGKADVQKFWKVEDWALAGGLIPQAWIWVSGNSFLRWPYSFRGHIALKILCLWRLNPFPSTDVYRLLECWAKIKPGNCIQMAVISTPPSFQVLMANITQFPKALSCSSRNGRACS